MKNNFNSSSSSNYGEVMAHQGGERQCEPQPDPIRRGLRGQGAEGDVEPAPRVVGPADPPLGVRNPDREPQPIRRRRRASRRCGGSTG